MRVLDTTEMGAAIYLDDDKIAVFDGEAGAFLYIEYVGSTHEPGSHQTDVSDKISVTFRAMLTTISSHHEIGFSSLRKGREQDLDPWCRSAMLRSKVRYQKLCSLMFDTI